MEKRSSGSTATLPIGDLRVTIVSDLANTGSLRGRDAGSSTRFTPTVQRAAAGIALGATFTERWSSAALAGAPPVLFAACTVPGESLGATPL